MGRQLDAHPVPGQEADQAKAQAAAHVGQDLASIRKRNAEERIR
jgi:hypothetical protein